MGIIQPHFPTYCFGDDCRRNHCLPVGTAWRGFKCFVVNSHLLLYDQEDFPVTSNAMKTPNTWSLWLESNFPDMSVQERNLIIDFAMEKVKTAEQTRVIKFRAFKTFGPLSLMLVDVTIHAASGMIGIQEEHFIEALSGNRLEDQ